MANVLAEALEVPQHSLGKFTGQLEALSGFPSEDSRLAAELLSTSYRKISGLGLDPRDTSPEELYEALGVMYKQTARRLAKAIGEGSSDGLKLRYGRLTHLLSLRYSGQIWSLKPPAIRKILRRHPPASLMKHLGYRTTASLLKRENERSLLAVAWQMESERWRRLVARSMAKLSVDELELTTPKLTILDERFWSGYGLPHPLVSSRPQSGIVVIWPNQLGNQMATLGIIALALQALSELADYSWALSSHELGSNFVKTATKLWQEEDPQAFRLAGYSVAWHSLRPYFDSLDPQPQLDWAQPHDMAAQLHLYRLHPALRWWSDCSWLVYAPPKARPVSLNIVDVAINHAKRLSLADATAGNGQKELFSQLMGRYLGHHPVSDLVLAKLSSSHPTGKGSKSSKLPLPPDSTYKLELGLQP